MSSENKSCFVIMPFSDTKNHSEKYWTDHFNKYLKKIIEEVDGVQVFRSQASRGAISSKILIDLIKSDIVVADLTDHNPNARAVKSDIFNKLFRDSYPSTYHFFAWNPVFIFLMGAISIHYFME